MFMRTWRLGSHSALSSNDMQGSPDSLSRAVCAALLLCVCAMSCSDDTPVSHWKGGLMRLPSPEEIAKLPPDGGPGFNRLIHEHSPYLLQHACNPVDWYPWGPEAFAKAKQA